jgi:cytidyltransferase-like protein
MTPMKQKNPVKKEAIKDSKIVFVTGCFDMLHSGHVAFLQEAATYGSLFVGIGSDANVHNLKGRYPVNTEKERKFMLDALTCVYECNINTGWGIMDFIEDIKRISPDILMVNEDGNTPEKKKLAHQLGIDYIVSKRIPHGTLPARSTTALRTECNIPFRVDLAGGWLDQPYVSKYYPGPVITISIEPTVDFNDRSGMASSTRRKAIELWNTDIPPGDREKLAKTLFCWENPPGTEIISGSQDSLGIVLPGLNKLYYNNHYWPHNIHSVMDETTLKWIEDHLFLVTLGPRESGYNVLDNRNITTENAKALSDATENCWNAILKNDLEKFGFYFKASFEAQVAMFPNMVDSSIHRTIDEYKNQAHGWKLSGAGGGGYLILVTDSPIEDAMKIKIRR